MAESAARRTEWSKVAWHGHGKAAGLLRALVSLGPVAAAGLLGYAVSRSVPGGGPAVTVIRVLLTAVVSVGAFLGLERVARRFLPLAALLRLNLVFPDRAPSRFSVALRSSSVRRLQRLVGEARRSDDVVVLAEKVVTLAAALNTHDRRTRGHCERTRALADLIIDELRLTPDEANQVRWGAFLHDVGKLVVPSEILNKPGKPTDREWEILRSHPEAGARLVEPLRAFLHAGVDAVASHHENYDGSGYPCGLRGDGLPLAARIVSVADAFEVMTAVRAYKRPMTLQAARAELARRSGTQFDPHVVRAFLNVSLGRLHWTLGLAAWIAEIPFLTVVPRVAAQLAPAGPGAFSQMTLPGLAAASLGAISMVPQVNSPPLRSGPNSVTSAGIRSPWPSPSPSPSPSPATSVEVGNAPRTVVGVGTGLTNGVRTTLGTAEPARSAAGSVVSTVTSTVTSTVPAGSFPPPTLPDVVHGVSTTVVDVVKRAPTGRGGGEVVAPSSPADAVLSSASSTVEHAVTGSTGEVDQVTEGVGLP